MANNNTNLNTNIAAMTINNSYKGSQTSDIQNGNFYRKSNEEPLNLNHMNHCVCNKMEMQEGRLKHLSMLSNMILSKIHNMPAVLIYCD